MKCLLREVGYDDANSSFTNTCLWILLFDDGMYYQIEQVIIMVSVIIIEEKYSYLGGKITLGNFNTGRQYGMATYVQVPLQE